MALFGVRRGGRMESFAALWDKALSFDKFVAASEKQKGLWEGLHRIAVVPDWAVAAVTAR